MKYFCLVLLFAVDNITGKLPCAVLSGDSFKWDDHSPIRIQVLQKSIDSAEELEILLLLTERLSSNQKLVIQAVGDDSETLEGNFVASSSYRFDEICSGIVQGSPLEAESIELAWTRPVEYRGPVHFRATVYDSSTNAVVSSTRSETVDIRAPLSSSRESVYDGCGLSKGCFGSPDGCVEAMDCDMVTTYVRNESDFTFEIFGRNKPNLTSFYTAVGFSDDMGMGNDCVVECVMYRSEVKTFMSFNEGRENKRDANVQVEVLETRYENDTIYCHFNLKETLTVRNFTCDLNVPYHLLLATGPSVVAHNIRQHTFVDISYEKIDLDSVAREEREAADVSVYDGCGVSKGCFGSPDGCVEAMDCDMITTYVRNESDFTFEIFGRNKPNLTNFYTAVGFSDDKRMGNDCVVECVLYRSEVKTFMSLNEGEENRRDANVKVDELEARYENDTVYCRFKLVERVTVKNFTCDLSVPQYVFLATGPALVAHNIRQHTHEEVSLEKIDFSVVAPDEEVADVYDGCGVSKGCFGAPRGCVDDKNCFMMTTYLRNGADYTFEIFGQNKHNMTNFYTAVGFSGDNRRMGNDCVVECVLYNSQLKTFVSSNEGEGNKRDPNVTVDVLATRYEQDAIYCQFKLKDMVVARNLSCDLNVAQYLLMATGRAFPQHTIHGHENDIASAEKIQLDEFGTSQEVTDVYEGCGVSKGCYGTPDGCVTGRTCDMMATYVRNESDYIFEIFGANAEKSDNFYTALGFSGDNRKMGDDCIVECVLYGDQVKAFASLNEGTDNARDPDMKVHLLGSRYENDTIYCQFKLDEVLTVNSFKCNLTVAQYLLLATGRSSSGHEINKHSKEKASADKIDLNFVGIDDGSFDDILMRLHGSFMVVAWLVFAPIGVISARYYKPKLKENVCGKDLWFTVHRTSMVLTWLLTLVAFVLIFIEVSGWSSHTAHAVIGCIATFLVFVQPIMAAFRPMPKAPNRPLFNWSHFLVGNSAHILAITCLFLALDITHVGASDWTLYLLIAFVIIYCCVHAAMTVTDRVASKRQAKADAEKTSKPKKYKNWKKSLILFSMFAAGIAIAVIVGITSQ